MSPDERIEVTGPGAAASHGGVAAGAGGVAVGRDVLGDVIVVHEGAHVAVTVQGENLRDRELAYLDGVLARYAYWRDHYTPLAGIAEVRAAVRDGPRLDLPMPFIPPGFQKLVEHGYGERAEVRRQPVDDLRAAVAEQRRILLLGDPGSGKTTTLWRLAYDYATAARDDARAPLPLLVPLGAYTGDEAFDACLGRHLGPLAPYLETYRAAGRLILLLDGLNEMPQAGYAARVGRIDAVLRRQPAEYAVVTCRALDYVVKLEDLQKVEVSPLDEGRMHTFLGHYLGPAAGERLFWAMAGGEEARNLWDTWRGAGGTWAAFWTADEMPKDVYAKTTSAQDRLWARLQKEPPPLLALGRNPYLLLMTAQVYATGGGALPANRARLFAAFVDTLLDREKARCRGAWIEAEAQKAALAALAHAMQAAGGRGTTVERGWAVGQLCRLAPGCDAERLLYLATSATLLDSGESAVRFYHQLLQEYFAASEMGRRVAAGEPLSAYWPPDRWWEPSGWEETAVLLAGMEQDASVLLNKLTAANPTVAGRCLVEGGASASGAARAAVLAALVDTMRDGRLPAIERAAAGRALAHLGDRRPGVGLDPESGLPDMAWRQVPAGPFVMGSDKTTDPQAYDDESPQHEVVLSGFAIGRFPVTNAQYAVFVEAGGYGERRFWTEAGWQWKGERAGPETYGGAFDLANHPVVMVAWYEAVAFCRWLTELLHQRGEIEGGEEVRLPTEAEWEKAARGTDGRIYPWGGEFDADQCNMGETGIGTTSAVGCFPGGASPYGAEEMSGNVWEWCGTKWRGSYEEAADESLAGDAPRVMRGGAFGHVWWFVRCASRSLGDPYLRDGNLGFRCVVAPVPSGL